VDLNLNLTPNSRRRPTPALPIPSLSHHRPKNAETEKKLRALKRELRINGIAYEVQSNDLQYLSELGNGTSGHVVKMKHKPSGAIIAVKVSLDQLCLSLILIGIIAAANASNWQ
jgi:mitogen-activated protein kinase kinase 7